MKGPSIAVMLAGKPEHDEESGSNGEPGVSEAKTAAKDAAKAFAQAVAAKDPDAIYRSFRSLSSLCKEIDDLEDSGESDEAESAPSEDKGEESTDED